MVIKRKVLAVFGTIAVLMVLATAYAFTALGRTSAASDELVHGSTARWQLIEAIHVEILTMRVVENSYLEKVDELDLTAFRDNATVCLESVGKLLPMTGLGDPEVARVHELVAREIQLFEAKVRIVSGAEQMGDPEDFRRLLKETDQVQLEATALLDSMAARSTQQLRADIVGMSDQFTVTMWAFIVLAIVACGALFGAYVGGRRIASSIVAITDVAREVARDGSSKRRAQPRSNDEIGELAVSFNRMTDALASAIEAARHELSERRRAEAERESLREQLAHAQKLEAIGTLAGGVAHDMNNVLASIIGYAEDMRDGLSEHVQDDAQQILEAVRRGTTLTRDLLGFARRGKYRKEVMAVGPLVTGVVQLLGRTLPKGVEITTEGEVALAIEGDSAQLGQAVINLCLNASDAMNGRGRLRLVLAEELLDESGAAQLRVRAGRYATITVTDNGAGMSREVQARMFEPFFTTKEQGRGTGLGLAMVYGTVANHSGALAVMSEVGLGTSITIYLPTTEAKTTAVPPKTSRLAATPGRTAPLILIVDDEPMLRQITQRTLERAGYQVVSASNGSEALEVFDQRRHEIRLVLLDMAMPGMNGPECFTELQERDPDVRVLLASGYALEAEAQGCLARGAYGYLEKPFGAAGLLAAIAQALRGERLRSGQATDAPPVRAQIASTRSAS